MFTLARLSYMEIKNLGRGAAVYSGGIMGAIEHENDRVGFGKCSNTIHFGTACVSHIPQKGIWFFKAWVTLKPEIKEQILKEERYGSDIKEIAFTDIPEVMEAVTSVTPPPYFQHRLVIGKGTYHSVIKTMDNGWRIICTIPESTFLEPVHTNIFYMSIFVGVITCLVIGRLSLLGSWEQNVSMFLPQCPKRLRGVILPRKSFHRWR